MKRYLFITIDTEEDNWGEYVSRPSVENIYRIPRLQEIFDRHSAVPTYLVNYPVASDAKAVRILNDIRKRGGCEIGSHLHPWNTPPLEEEGIPRNYFMHNLPVGLIRRKMETLQGTIRKNFGVEPVSFRAGRWGFGPGVASVIRSMGYRVDTSMTPFCEWDEYEGGAVFGLKNNRMFYFNENEFTPPRGRGRRRTAEGGAYLLQVPPTMGFLQPYFVLADLMRNMARRAFFSRLRAPGILEKLRLMNYRWLSPENTHVGDMIRLSRRVLGKGHPFLNMFFHSTSLGPGKSPFIKTEGDVDEMLGRIDAYLQFIRREKIMPVGLSRAGELMR